MKSMKKQKGEFLIGTAILFAIFMSIVIGAEVTSAEREADLKAKTQQVQEQKK